MDLEDWELLSINSFKDLDLDIEEDHHGVIVMDHEDTLHKTESSPSSIVVPKTLLQVPVTWEPVLDQETTKLPELEPDPDSKQTFLLSPRVSFKIMKETEFVDMKIYPPMKITSPVHQEEGDDLREKKEVILEEEGDKRMNLWKVGLNGIGAICSFGVAAAAATVCVFFLGHNNIKICKNKNKNKNQMLRFQIYSDDHKGMKEEGNKATKVNEAIFGMKGVPVVRAQISFGGYYNA